MYVSVFQCGTQVDCFDQVSIGTLGIGTGALVAGLFGMNVRLCLEMVVEQDLRSDLNPFSISYKAIWKIALGHLLECLCSRQVSQSSYRGWVCAGSSSRHTFPLPYIYSIPPYVAHEDSPKSGK